MTTWETSVEARFRKWAMKGIVRQGKPAAKPASSQLVAPIANNSRLFRPNWLASRKQIADLKSFSKGEAPGANGLQLHKRYSTEPVEDQVHKLEEKRKSVAAQMDAVSMRPQARD